MLLAASKVDSAVESAVHSGEPAHVARYAFQLAQAFNNFYQKYSIIHEPDREKKGIPAVDDGFLPASTGAHRVNPGDSDSRVYVDGKERRGP